MNPELIEKIKKLPAVITLDDMSWNKTGSWSLQKPLFKEKYPPCQEGCPTHVPIREIMSLVKNRDFAGAAKLFIEVNPFPAITGRVCHHPCMQKCLRKEFDESLEIRAVERFISKYAEKHAAEISKTNRNIKAAIIGSGPSGLVCAYYLGLAGVKVKVFEMYPEPGGLLRYGIPPYRLPENILNKEIKRLKNYGIEFKTRIKVTGKFIETELADYDAVFLGIGAHVSKNMGIPGDDNKKVISGLKFLSDHWSFKAQFNGQKIAVIGGGNTAMDAARTAYRMGADVDIIYRRTRNEMPAIPEEIEGAEEEGIHFEFLTAPEKIEPYFVSLKLHCIRMKLGKPDSSGRRRPIPVTGSNFEKAYDYVITAIGEDADIKDFSDSVTIEDGAIKTDHTGQTGINKIYAGGDAADKDRTVIDAIASGRIAAASICNKLRIENSIIDKSGRSTIESDNINSAYFRDEQPFKPDILQPIERTENFDEIIGTLSAKQAVEEAGRCFSCGGCTFCDNCLIFCPDFAIQKSEKGYTVKEEYCKGCGICIKECPRGVFQWRDSK
jgi:NADPH-dependent glutamate synthase beta subunit-like oxidoreductase